MDALSLEALVSKLCALGIRASLEGDRITFTPAPPAELRGELLRHRGELLRVLREVARTPGEPVRRAVLSPGPEVEREAFYDAEGRMVAFASWKRVSGGAW